jgi:AraC-like DNA-binding protein
MLVSEISEVVGYDNFSNFTNMFRKNVGISPSKYRECKSGKFIGSTRQVTGESGILDN